MLSRPWLTAALSVRAWLIAGAMAAGIWAAFVDGPPRRAGAASLQPWHEASTETGISSAGAGAGFADVQMAGPLPVRILRVVDGDTVEVRVQVWLGQAVQTRVRLRGIDAPELNGACGAEREQAIAARDRLGQLLRDQPVWLTDVGRDKYFGRVVARLTDQQGADLGGQLVAEGLARPYDGGRRNGWCRWGS